MLTDTLRSGTRIHHDRIEQKLGLPHSVGTQEEYRALLEGFYGFYQGAEPLLQELLVDFAEFRISERQKLPLLYQDLAMLGLTPTDLRNVPLCESLPPLETVPQALGCLYVLEGSTLGGQVISAHFKRNLGVTAKSGGRYFHGYGAETAGFWRSFKEALLTYSQSYPEHDYCILESARTTFESLESWLCRDLLLQHG